jgi:hypothetical protein
MKKKYNTLNEEINRIKSLFNEGRLYGNLVDKEEEIITEQRKFLSNITDAFSIALKTTDPKILKKFQDFMNVEIRNVDDIIKHVDDFEDLWGIVVPNLNTSKVKVNLVKVKNAIEGGKLNNLSEEKLFNSVLPGFPEKGGMRDMIYDFWLEANGKSINLPQKVETRIVKTDPNTGALVIGTKNEKGVIVYKNEKGEVSSIENPTKQDSGSGKSKDSDVESERFRPDIEDADFVEVPSGSDLGDLNGKKIKATEENLRNLSESVVRNAEDATEKGNKTIISFSFEGEGSEEIAKQFMEDFRGKNVSTTTQEATQEVAQEVVEQGIKNRSVDIKDKNKYLKYTGDFLNKLFTKYPTKLWLNPAAIGEGIWKQNHGWWLKTKEYGGKVIFRSILIPTTAFIAWSSIRSKKQDRSYLRGYIADASVVIKKISDWVKNLSVKEDVLGGLEDSIRILSDNKIDPDIIKKNLIDAATMAITGVTTGESFLSCEDIINNSDSEIIKKSFSKIKVDENDRISELLKNEGESLDIDTINEIKSKTKKVLDFVVDQGLLDESQFNTLVRKTRSQCEETKKLEELEKELDEKIKEGTVEIEIDGDLI